jgi:hypothetical protein
VSSLGTDPGGDDAMGSDIFEVTVEIIGVGR